MSVARTILSQLGGNKFAVMTGAKNFIDLKNGIRMKIGRNKTNANWMEITLNSLDLYDVAFAKLTRLGERKSLKEYKNIYNDSLVELFERHTGMYTSL